MIRATGREFISSRSWASRPSPPTSISATRTHCRPFCWTRPFAICRMSLFLYGGPIGLHPCSEILQEYKTILFAPNFPLSLVYIASFVITSIFPFFACLFSKPVVELVPVTQTRLAPLLDPDLSFLPFNSLHLLGRPRKVRYTSSKYAPMMTATAYPPTMSDLRGDPSHASVWPNYGASHMSGRLGSSIDAAFSSSGVRPRAGQDHYSSYTRYSQDEGSTFDRPQPTTLSSHQNYPPLKRSFSQAESQPYQEIVQDLRDDNSRLTVSQDHKLLSFRRSQEKSTVVDQHGRVQQLELSAQLHGMFFLSEMPPNSGDNSALQPELTCYRRNLFQISGSFVTPRGPISVVNEANETVPVTNMDVTISAIESVDGNPVRLIVIPWKTPPPNSPEQAHNPDQEPPALPLIPFQESSPGSDGEYAVYPVGWRRLQFRIVTANNGRRKELQQHFVLHLKVHGTLADNTKVVLTESITSPIVVRGRSPRNFQARKEIPLLGSSAGSRGQALVETGVGVPRSAFTFSPPKPAAGQPSALRSKYVDYCTVHRPDTNKDLFSSYPSWNQQNDSLHQLPTTSTMGGPSISALASDSSELPLATSLGPPVSLSQYAPTAGAIATEHVPRYVDNGRSAKSPRHQGQSSVHGSISASDSASDYRYGSYRASVTSDASNMGYAPDSTTTATQRDYYPSSGGTWTSSTTEPTTNLNYPSASGGNAHHPRPYAFDRHSKQEATLPNALYTPGAKGAFESMSNYSWSTN
ncbi:acid phosphatase phoG-Penicillium chrysogenum [Cordyceps militaris]|uniref:Acid phosphatase phoG-Penicillium chrysogenum n=1 Tax=Cordyceps militaris TaxID=73501 RepID=A0A2H4S5D2_CORMI|nr:acid phosphatase phoG-Penicillium chrysogenum [Cordyceps militaris]